MCVLTSELGSANMRKKCYFAAGCAPNASFPKSRKNCKGKGTLHPGSCWIHISYSEGGLRSAGDQTEKCSRCRSWPQKKSPVWSGMPSPQGVESPQGPEYPQGVECPQGMTRKSQPTRSGIPCFREVTIFFNIIGPLELFPR